MKILTLKNRKIRNTGVMLGLTLLAFFVSFSSFGQKEHHLNTVQISNLVKLPIKGTNATWSNSGDRIAFTSEKMDGIYVVDLNGGNMQTITTEAGAGYKFKWSPDDKHIAYRSTVFEGKKRIQSIKVFSFSDETNAVLAQGRRMQTPSWILIDRAYDVVYVDAKNNVQRSKTKYIPDTEQLQQIQNHAKSRAVISSVDGIYLIDSGKTDLISPSGFDPIISPDQTKVAYSEFGSLVIYNIADRTSIKVPSAVRASWSPDSSKIVYQITKDDGYKIISSGLYTYDLANSENSLLVDDITMHEDKASWSPTGTHIVFSDTQTDFIYTAEIK